MEQEILARMHGISGYGYFSLTVFISFFVGMLVWAFTKKRNYLDKMGQLPLDSGETDANDQRNAE